MIISYKGINVSYTDTGKGGAVVLLHGFLEDLSMWVPFLPELSKRNRVICIDLLGHGHTGCLGYIHSMELMAEVVAYVLEQLEIEQSTMIGHSMGGYVALAFAEKKPKALKGICLMNSTAGPDNAEKKQNRDRAIQAVKQNHKTFIRLAVNNLFRPKNRTHFKKQIESIIDGALKTPLQGIIAALEGMKIRPDRTHVLHDHLFHKLMIVSKKDPVLDYKTLIDQTKNTNVQVIEFPDGHMSHIENESDFLTNIMHFIEKI